MLDHGSVERLNEEIYMLEQHTQQLMKYTEGRILERLNEVEQHLRMARAILKSVRTQENITKTASWN